jgi:hypothetical protein
LLQALQCPQEIVWLNGAPGSGKGANTPFILQSRGLSRAVTMSSLLDSNEEIRELKAKGELVPDGLSPRSELAPVLVAGLAPQSRLQVSLQRRLVVMSWEHGCPPKRGPQDAIPLSP